MLTYSGEVSQVRFVYLLHMPTLITAAWVY